MNWLMEKLTYGFNLPVNLIYRWIDLWNKIKSGLLHLTLVSCVIWGIEIGQKDRTDGTRTRNRNVISVSLCRLSYRSSYLWESNSGLPHQRGVFYTLAHHVPIVGGDMLELQSNMVYMWFPGEFGGYAQLQVSTQCWLFRVTREWFCNDTSLLKTCVLCYVNI
jgi:hypothetical protein